MHSHSSDTIRYTQIHERLNNLLLKFACVQTSPIYAGKLKFTISFFALMLSVLGKL